MAREFNFTFTILFALFGFFIGSVLFQNEDFAEKISLSALGNNPVLFLTAYFASVLRNFIFGEVYGLITGAIFGLIGLLIDTLRKD
jgi:hypothetical protein